MFQKQQVCQTGEFLVAEIDAKVGGFGIVPPELEGAIVSSHYFLFVIDEAKLLIGVFWVSLYALISSRINIEALKRISTNYLLPFALIRFWNTKSLSPRFWMSNAESSPASKPWPPRSRPRGRCGKRRWRMQRHY